MVVALDAGGVFVVEGLGGTVVEVIVVLAVFVTFSSSSS